MGQLKKPKTAEVSAYGGVSDSLASQRCDEPSQGVLLQGDRFQVESGAEAQVASSGRPVG